MTVGQNPGDLFDSMQYWRHLSDQAEAGVLEIPEDVAAQCDAACVTYIAHLEGMVQKTEFLVDLKAFGTLPSAQQLGRKFKRLADGEERSAAVAIRQHIEVIELMRSVFRRYFVETEGVDQSVAARIGGIGAGLGE
ncbi:hypothetical protein CH251_16175 [Rhodococcus sp. 06-462-5]|uniref:hypothetical protein n=1 Tax=unclassified Rhodococcus (in: high G+C Gram-positive bacteria) TaxID=192944 RepID=UPI000B9A2138|nr:MULTISPECIES: hypothetical protein [unclassified Rhodococcus (in: high G+C Gram-positive bacteria)]OZC71312.1 hypothetical protein CH251_16175 [Rhodococcus sp. 06-462-5]OZE70441.1 hypothetical protein CH270_00315 [Rhodococcus sp. 02-925g]